MTNKKRILESSAFHKWWEARKHVSPVPSNPYHAYMTDMALKAEIPEKREEWNKQPNRRDQVSIDFPPYIRRKIDQKKHKPMPRRETLERRREVKQFLGKIAEQERIVLPKLVAHGTRGYLRSRSISRQRRMAGGGLPFRIELPLEHTVEVGLKGRKSLLKATAAHELGHVKYRELKPLQKEMEKQKVYSEKHLRGYDVPTLVEEKLAWKFAVPYFSKKPEERAKQKWLKRFALETYYQGTHGIPRKGKMKWTLI